MQSIIESIFGTYTPVTYQVTEYIEDTVNGVLIPNTYDVIPAGLAGCDWTYILGVAVFIVTLYCVLRIIGAVISNV